MRAILHCGSVPLQELPAGCTGGGTMREDCFRYLQQLRRTFPLMGDMSFEVMQSDWDGVPLFQVCLLYNDGDEREVAHAYTIFEQLPKKWQP